MDGPLLGQQDWATSTQVANLTIGFAQLDAYSRSPLKPFNESPQLMNLVIGIALLGLTVIGASLIVVWIRKKFQADQDVVSPNDLLSDFRRLREKGVMSEAEFNRIRGLLGNKLRQEAGQTPVDLATLPPLETSDAPLAEEFQSADSEYEWEDIDLHTFEDDKTPPSGSEKSS